jgi:hypothetical protein
MFVNNLTWLADVIKNLDMDQLFWLAIAWSMVPFWKYAVPAFFQYAVPAWLNYKLEMKKLDTPPKNRAVRFLIAIHHPDSYDPAGEDQAMIQAIDELNDDMAAAGVRLFVGGLHKPDHSLTITADQQVQPGPTIPSHHHIAEIWVLELNSIEEATKWGQRAAKACQTKVEVRPFHF